MGELQACELPDRRQRSELLAHADPEANASGSPSVVRTVSKAIGASGETSLSTLTYHCSIGMAPSGLTSITSDRYP